MSFLKSGIGSWIDRNTGRKSVWPLAGIVAVALTLASCSNFQNLSSSNTSKTPARQSLVISSTLPAGGVGTTYDAVLSVSGGSAPYIFGVASGTLPTGLTLNPRTGTISGVPTQTGTFEFGIWVTDGSLGASAARSYTVAVSACQSCAKVAITPAAVSVASGGKVQLTAIVSNVSNTGVTWKTSAGSISTTGLLTAPTVSASSTVTVTATSVADPSSQASAAVAVSSAGLAISTFSIPNATSGVPYSTTLAASGGQVPYQWSIASGSLPQGVLLQASTGGLTGTISQSGSFAFSVRVADAASQSVQQNLTLVVTATNAGCGPPKYSCSRTDLQLARVPLPVPNMGNLTGAGQIVNDPVFSNPVARITDAKTNPGSLNLTYMAGQGGSADANIWNVDSSLLFVQDTGSWMIPLAFDATSMRATRLYASSYASDGGLKLNATGAWSFTDPNVLYTIDHTTPTLEKYDFTDRVTPPAPTQLFDFRSGTHCLPAGFTATWSDVGGVSADDTVFAVAYSSTGSQGTGVIAVAYKAGKGCALLNTQTGQVTGDWGTQGRITVPDRFTIHNVKLSKDGNWLVIVNSTCFVGTCEGPFFWQIGTTTVSSCGGNGCGGHWTEGYTSWVNQAGAPEMGQYDSRNFATPVSSRPVIAHFPVGLAIPFDQHSSWNNADPADSYPFFSTTWTTNTSAWIPWYNEVLGISPIDGSVWRFAHTYISASSQRFSTQYAIGGVSQDGRFFAFSSDWMGTLGSESGSANCTVGTNCRGDVFVVQLK